MKIQVKVLPKQFVLSDYSRAKLHDFVVAEGGEIRAELVTLTPESRKQRKFLHGAVLSLWAYLNDLDYKDPKVMDYLFELAKREFTPDCITIDKKVQLFGKSSKGSKALNHLLEKIVDHLEEQYGIDRAECLNPDDYKYFMDEVFMHGEYDGYLDYLLKMNKLPKK